MKPEDFDSDWGDEPTKHDAVAAGPMEVIDLTVRIPSLIDNAKALALDVFSIGQTLSAKTDETRSPTLLELSCISVDDEGNN